MVCKELFLPPNGQADLPSGETVLVKGDSLIVQFPDPRHVLSTSWLNGGLRSDLTAVFNHQISLAACDTCHAGDGSVLQYLKGVARDLGLDPETTTGLITRAEMKNTAIVSESFRDLSVTAIVTAGIDKNGGRAGDPASFYENGDSVEPIGGTINTIILIDADLPEYAMTRAVMTASEAKAAALQQLMARSMYSTGIATGSGTDMIVIVSDPVSSRYLSNAGKHSKLGELIGSTVIRATTIALERETGLSAESQRDVLARLSRFGITGQDIWSAAVHDGCVERPCPEMQERFIRYLQIRARHPETVARVAAALHVLDEEEWGLIPREAAGDTITRILGNEEGEVPAAGNRSSDLVTALFARMISKELCTAENTVASPTGKTGTD